MELGTFPEVSAHLPNGTTLPAKLLSAEQAFDNSTHTTLRLLLTIPAKLPGSSQFPGIQIAGAAPRPLAEQILSTAKAASWPTTPTRLRLTSVTLDIEELTRTLHNSATNVRDSVTAAIEYVTKALLGTVVPGSPRR